MSSAKTLIMRHHIKSKGLALLIEHSPCCLLSAIAGFIHLPILNHNPTIELGFAIGGAIAGEFVGHKYFHPKSQIDSQHNSLSRKARFWSSAKGYGLALTIGLTTWGIHQKLFHHHHDEHDHKHTKIERKNSVASLGFAV